MLNYLLLHKNENNIIYYYIIFLIYILYNKINNIYIIIYLKKWKKF